MAEKSAAIPARIAGMVNAMGAFSHVLFPFDGYGSPKKICVARLTFLPSVFMNIDKTVDGKLCHCSLCICMRRKIHARNRLFLTCFQYGREQYILRMTFHFLPVYLSTGMEESEM